MVLAEAESTSNHNSNINSIDTRMVRVRVVAELLVVVALCAVVVGMIVMETAAVSGCWFVVGIVVIVSHIVLASNALSAPSVILRSTSRSMRHPPIHLLSPPRR
jgi:uncharacterized oligopeptide transporter (OPT) family protein